MPITTSKSDREILFPNLTILKASAGSGKTHALTRRFLQFILSDSISRNSLRNILAITFSNNAALEMKERIIEWLKGVCIGDDARISELLGALSISRDVLTGRSEEMIAYIFRNYTDFQVKTVDSFMTTIFKSTAVELGVNPEFDILFQNDELINYSFNLFLRRVRKGTPEAGLLEELIPKIVQTRGGASSYIWDPSLLLLSELKSLYRKAASVGRRIEFRDHSPEIELLQKRISEEVDSMERLIDESGLQRSSGSSYPSIVKIVSERRYADLTEKGFARKPVKKPGKSSGKSVLEDYSHVVERWEELHSLVSQLTYHSAVTYYTPYQRLYARLEEVIEWVKRLHGKIFIEDINYRLAEYLNKETVPDIYFRLGDVIYHYLIDEFQDTSPIQWRNLHPLLENSLAQGGSLFIVGDTKQAIYGFRDADYRIMKDMEAENPFPSASHSVEELHTNYRSSSMVLEYNAKLFKEVLADSEYLEAAKRSGHTDYRQGVKEGNVTNGYVETAILSKSASAPERRKIVEIIESLLARGCRYEDIALLTMKNADVVRITEWLNEENIPVISYSSLDIRRRKITGEIVSLLNFLDSPLDDLSFASFLLGDIFSSVAGNNSQQPIQDLLLKKSYGLTETPHTGKPPEHNTSGSGPLYKVFREEFREIWEKYFEGLFNSTGFLPLYDLVSEVFRVFKLFEVAHEEEAALVKLLEVVMNFEERGGNALREFVEFAGEYGDEPAWDMAVPGGISAVNVMTVHKAKGLGFPVVILLLYEERVSKGFPYILMEDAAGIHLLRLKKAILKNYPPFEELYEEERSKAQVNSLNSLYVALTRAESEMYIIGVPVDDEKKRYPLDLLSRNPGSGPLSDSKEGTERSHFLSSRLTDASGRLRVYHPDRSVRTHSGSHALSSYLEKRRGDLIHRVLSRIELIDEENANMQAALDLLISEKIEEAVMRSPDRSSCLDIKELLLGFLQHEVIWGYFLRKRGRITFNEKDYSDSSGRLFRMDRVVIDEDAVTVIDYKTGRYRESEAEGYRRQIHGYMNILREIYPEKSTEGLLAYVDHMKVVEVR